ncbi:MAG: hypothetical protein RSE27_05245, partial [Ruthenibacterium sp.]
DSEPMAKYRPRQGTHPGANAWREIMNTEQADTVKYPVKEFPVDETVVKHAFCASSGYFAGPNCPAVTGYYKATTTLPVCSLH